MLAATRRIVRLETGPLPATIAWLRRGGVVPVEARLGDSWQARAAAWRDDPAVECACCLSTATLLDGSPIDAMLARLTVFGWLTEERRQTAQQVLVEALANAIRHGNLEDRPPREATRQQRARGVGLCARRDGDAVAFSIVQEAGGPTSLADQLGAAAAREAPPDPLAEGGLGLFLVARLSARWAVDEDGRRLTVWI